MKFYYTYACGKGDGPYDYWAYNIYDTFDKVCDALDIEITNWLSVNHEGETYTPPDRNAKLKELKAYYWSVQYYKFESQTFIIKRLHLAE